MKGLGHIVAAALAVGLAGPAAPPAGAAASEWAANPESRVRLITPYRVAPAEGEVWLGLHFRLTPEWHVYWKNSGDAGFPPVIEPAEGSALAAAELLWPAPERYELAGDLVAFGYEDEVVYPVRARLAAAGSERADLTLNVDYLVCKVDCIPYRYTLRVDQPVAPEAEADPETAPLLASWRARLPVPAAEVPGVETEARLDVSDLARPVLTVSVEGARAAPGERPEVFFEAHDLYEPARPELQEGSSGLRFRVPLGVKRKLERAPTSAAFAWTVTGLAPPAGAGEGAEVLALEAAQTVPVGTGDDAAAGPPADYADGREREGSLAGLLLAALGGGLLLAATPGALALVLVLVGALRRLAAERPDDVVARSLTAAGGTLAVGLALGAADLATPGSGWNHLLQAPPVLTALALATLLFALGLWGFLGVRGGSAGTAVSVRGGGPAFGAGALLALLALPWPLPPAAPALDRAAGLGGGTVLAAALAVAAGLALPVVTAGLVLRRGAGAAAQPASGGRRREALGFLAAASLVWLLYVLSGLLDSEDLAFVELSLLGLGLAAWGRSRAARPAARRLWGALAAAAGAAALWISVAS